MRITVKNLEQVADLLNRATNSPLSYSVLNDGKREIQVGHFHISRAYGGFDLYRTVNKCGGVSDVLRGGHRPARELYDLMHAMLQGIEQKY
jgi:hypothetical protein